MLNLHCLFYRIIIFGWSIKYIIYRSIIITDWNYYTSNRMNSNRLVLFRAVVASFAQKKQASVRKLYTDTIYPYPFNYMNTKVWPSRHAYRETFIDAPWQAYDDKCAWVLQRMFWTWFFYQLFHDPGVILGHFHPPDTSLWTDAELGIPPLEAGSYEDWLAKKAEQQ